MTDNIFITSIMSSTLASRRGCKASGSAKSHKHKVRYLRKRLIKAFRFKYREDIPWSYSDFRLLAYDFTDSVARLTDDSQACQDFPSVFPVPSCSDDGVEGRKET